MNPCMIVNGMAAPQAIPDVIDHYRLLRPLGRGGAAVVYEAEDTLLGRRVALKLFPGVPSSSLAARQILREAQLAHAVRHPHVVALYHVGAYKGGVYLVMEVVRGRSLQALLDSGPLPWPEATAILSDVCKGVMAVHAGGIVHRDIKPANLLRTLAGGVKLADFGLARRLGPGRKSPASRPSAGTPHYMSPEQCRGEECDERTDIYALGATYHTLLTGRTPYADAAPLQVMFAHCSAPVPDPRRILQEVPCACAEIVMRAMAKKRVDRYDSARDMQRALRAVSSVDLQGLAQTHGSGAPPIPVNFGVSGPILDASSYKA